MSKIKNLLLPLLSMLNLIDPETGELKIRYRVGHPRSYKFDASRGTFGIVNGDTLTKKGEPFSFVPVAYRIFRDDILGYGLKNWAEFFFVNEAGQMSSILFHGYSVENLNMITSDLYYDDVNLSETLLTVTPTERMNKKESAKYYIAEFSYKVLDEKEKEAVRVLADGLSIYREGTVTGEVKIELSANYKPPINMINGSGSVGANSPAAETGEAGKADSIKQTESEKTEAAG